MANNKNVQSSMCQKVTIPFKAIGDSIREPYGSSLVDLNSATGFLKSICEENLSRSNVTQLIHPPQSVCKDRWQYVGLSLKKKKVDCSVITISRHLLGNLTVAALLIQVPYRITKHSSEGDLAAASKRVF